jgi:hypothetical protein
MASIALCRWLSQAFMSFLAIISSAHLHFLHGFGLGLTVVHGLNVGLARIHRGLVAFRLMRLMSDGKSKRCSASNESGNDEGNGGNELAHPVFSSRCSERF